MDVDSPIEAELLAALLPAGWTPTSYSLGEWTLHAQYQTPHGRLDFAILGPDRRIDVECDGWPWHEATPEQAARDAARDRALVLDGWTVLRFTGREIHRTPEVCVRDIMRAIGVEWSSSIGGEACNITDLTPKEGVEVIAPQDAFDVYIAPPYAPALCVHEWLDNKCTKCGRVFLNGRMRLDDEQLRTAAPDLTARLAAARAARPPEEAYE